MNKIHSGYIGMVSVVFLLVLQFSGCSNPTDTSPSHTKILNPDQDDNIGGSFLESTDIRTMAQQVCTELLALPEISNSPDLVKIAMGGVKNSTRYTIDTSLLLKRLRLDLNRHAQGQLRFFARDSGEQVRRQLLKERQQTEVQTAIEETAKYIACSDIIKNAKEPVVLTLSPVANTNLFNLNANSFAMLLRTKIKEHAGDKVLFTRANSSKNADYTLTGEFFAQSIKVEGIANTVKDVEWAQNNPEKWHNPSSINDNNSSVNGIQVNNTNNPRMRLGPNTTYKAIDPSLWNSPNVTKTFNVMLVNEKDIALFEKVVDLEKQIKSGQENAKYILAGEISSLTKSYDGKRSDYVLVTYYLNDPVSNETLWEYGYEVKRESSRSVLYR